MFFIISGVLGFVLYYNGNMEFELEMYFSMKGVELIWEILKGVIFVLVFGSMIVIGLLGWVYIMK